MIFDFAVVGAGPAGAYFSYLLAASGKKVVVFDHSQPREKPCGGGIGAFGVNKFPILNELKNNNNIVYKTKLVSVKGRTAITKGSFALILPRKELDWFLLNKAVNAKAKWVKEKVVSFKKEQDWIIKTTAREYYAKNIVGADGVNSIVRKKFVGQFEPNNLSICVGYYIKNLDIDYAIIKFLRRTGYLWVFPRKNNSTIGIGINLQQTKKDLFEELDSFVNANFSKIQKIGKFSALVPIIRDKKFYDLPCAGQDWILIGDAAGHVDPVTAEGIFYALWSAELASKAALQNNLKSFNGAWKKAYGKNLISGTNLLPVFYNPFLIEMIVLFSSVSKTFSKLIFDLFTSQQWYRDLHINIAKKGFHILAELVNPWNWANRNK